jgi:glycosyltransferase involved in cell wall biosynthesis
VRVVSRPNRGPAAARNTGLAETRCGLIAFLDADDLWHAEKLRLQLACLEADPGLSIVFTHVRNFVSPDYAPPDGGAGGPAGAMPGLIPSSMLVRRQAFDACGRFDETLLLGDLVPWLGCARDLGLRSHTLAEVLVERRIHSSNLGRTHVADRRDYLLAVKQMLDRRRRAT